MGRGGPQRGEKGPQKGVLKFSKALAPEREKIEGTELGKSACGKAKKVGQRNFVIGVPPGESLVKHQNCRGARNRKEGEGAYKKSLARRQSKRGLDWPWINSTFLLHETRARGNGNHQHGPLTGGVKRWRYKTQDCDGGSKGERQNQGGKSRRDGLGMGGTRR